MHLPNINVPPNIAEQFSNKVSLTIFERMCLLRYFEFGIVQSFKDKTHSYNAYLSSGQEAVAASLAFEISDYLIFTQHRAHDIYLFLGGSPMCLRDELLGMITGTSQGKAGSNCLQFFGNGISMFGHHGLIGENVPLGVGAALGSGKNTVCIFGDGAAEEDYVLAAMGFAATHKLPVLFVCIDNNLSILTPVEVRRSWSIVDVAASFGIHSMEVSDDPWAVLHHTREMTKTLPALINFNVCRGYWHVGTGVDGAPKWDRFQMVKDNLVQLGLESEMHEVENEICNSMEELWGAELLLKPLGI